MQAYDVTSNSHEIYFMIGPFIAATISSKFLIGKMTIKLSPTQNTLYNWF